MQRRYPAVDVVCEALVIFATYEILESVYAFCHLFLAHQGKLMSQVSICLAATCFFSPQSFYMLKAAPY